VRRNGGGAEIEVSERWAGSEVEASAARGGDGLEVGKRRSEGKN